MNRLPFRQVISTHEVQFVKMNLLAGESIPKESHEKFVQYLEVIEGLGVASLGNVCVKLSPGVTLAVSRGVEHGIWNVADTPLKMEFVYSPPAHEEGLIEETPSETLSELCSRPEMDEKRNAYANAFEFFARVATREEKERMRKFLCPQEKE